MRYDAMGVGNHEFDYGWQVFERGITRVPFPILCCNIRYKGDRRPLLPAATRSSSGTACASASSASWA